MPDIDLLGISRGAVVAPAGFGKTHLIAASLQSYSGNKPVLVLTHTNAGVMVLQRRFRELGVSSSRYHLYTIDGWCRRLVGAFPDSCTYDVSALSGADYAGVISAAYRGLNSHALDRILQSSYQHILVDEYQDCSLPQHQIISHLAETIPTCVLGDPMQAIFGLGGTALADWDKDVLASFPQEAELQTPWRWARVGHHKLGDWLQEIRVNLQSGIDLNFSSIPTGVPVQHTLNVEGSAQRIQDNCIRYFNMADQHRLLVIDHASAAGVRNGRAKRCVGTGGCSIVEPVELNDLRQFANNFDCFGESALEELLGFATKLMIGVSAPGLIKRVQSLESNKARNPPNAVELIALELRKCPNPNLAAAMLEELANDSDRSVYRWGLLKPAINALKHWALHLDDGFASAVSIIIEQSRYTGRYMPRKAIGSTLLLKGLEAEHAVILDADALDSRHLYVAMTRGSHSLTVGSKSTVVLNRD